jgi:hypothetical protein
MGPFLSLLWWQEHAGRASSRSPSINKLMHFKLPELFFAVSGLAPFFKISGQFDPLVCPVMIGSGGPFSFLAAARFRSTAVPESNPQPL